MDSNIERWHSMKEICEYHGVSRDTVLGWIDRREMPATKIGRLWKRWRSSRLRVKKKPLPTASFFSVNCNFKYVVLLSDLQAVRE